MLRWLKSIQPSTLPNQTMNYFVMWRHFWGLHVCCPYWRPCNVWPNLLKVVRYLFVTSSLLWSFVKQTFTIYITILRIGFRFHTSFFPWSCLAQFWFLMFDLVDRTCTLHWLCCFFFGSKMYMLHVTDAKIGMKNMIDNEA